MSTPPQEAPPRLTEGDSAVGRLLKNAAEAPLDSSPIRRNRIWLQLAARRSAPLRFLIPVAAALAVAIAVGWSLRPQPVPLAPAMFAFSSGGPAVGEPVKGPLITGPNSRVFARFVGGGALILPDSRLDIRTAAGRVELELAAGKTLASAHEAAVTAGEYRLEVAGALFGVKVAMDRTFRPSGACGNGAGSILGGDAAPPQCAR